VEDDFADAMLLQQALGDAGWFDFEMEVVRTLRDARAKLAKRRFDLIIADLRLPDSAKPNATVALIQKHADGAPILVLTGSAGLDAEQIGSSVTVLDKNAYFHRRDDRKSEALLQKVREAMVRRDDGDDGDTLMI
jgi:DNA-binding NtrC family response regulator